MSEFVSGTSASALIVRVKRKRTEESNESLCIVESDGRKKLRVARFGQARTKLLMRRFETIDVIDDPENTELNGHGEIEDMAASRRVMKEHGIQSDYVVTKKLRNSSSSSAIVVNLSHVSAINWEQCGKLNNPTPKPRVPGTRILDPATRQLNIALNTAQSTGNYSDMLQAVEMGANINFQRPSDGLTALMVAVQLSNSQVVSYLLNRGADAFLLDQDAKSAMDYADYAKVENRGEASSQVAMLLRVSASQQKLNSSDSRSAVESVAREVPAEDCVYDIYHLEASLAEEGREGDGMEEGDERRQSSSSHVWEAAGVPVVPVPGLRIEQKDGSMDLAFCYDSDWSDLAEDDEVDSNDENYYANDYPEEEEEGMEGGLYRDGADSDESDEGRRGRGGHEDENIGGEAMPRFERKGVGRVLQPFMVGGHDGSSVGGGHMSAEALGELWGLGEQGGEDDDDEGGRDTRRLEEMAKRTGMAVGVAPREFERNGMPKYGAELSDDDLEQDWAHYGDGDAAVRGFYHNDVAYDSELDT